MRSLLLLLLAIVLAQPANAGTVTSSEVTDVAITIYRDPNRDAGAMNAAWPGGYALITETRTITVPKGESQVRFENVAEGLLPETAIITGLPGGVREKNRDARLISPAGLVDAYLKRSVRIRRTDPATGRVSEESAIIQAGPNSGVLLKTAAGYEALHCSGLPERMIYGGVPEDLSARPTLSVLTRSDRAVTATIQLTYMAQGFDWAANYVANRTPASEDLNLFAWLTVANGGQQSFPDARLMVIAGKPNKQRNNPPPPPPRPSLDLKCWPQDVTSTHARTEWYRMAMPYIPSLSRFDDIGRNYPGSYVSKQERRRQERLASGGGRFKRADRFGYANAPPPPPPPAPVMMMEAPMAMSVVSEEGLDQVVTAQRAVAQQEELGDLKLYRVPMRVTVAAQSQKQVALLQQPAARFRPVYSLNASEAGPSPQAMQLILRTLNTREEGLGLPLPSGSLALFERVARRNMLVGEHAMEDLAEGQEVELRIGESPDVQMVLARIQQTASGQVWRVTITNAKDVAIRAEVLVPYDLAERSPDLVRRAGGWALPLDVPANGVATMEYRVKL